MVTSSDEKTGVQALSHLKVTPIKKGKDKKVDSEYIRNGTTCLIAARDVRTGKISAYTQGQKRTEQDF